MLMNRSLANTSNFFTSSPCTLVEPEMPYLKVKAENILFNEIQHSLSWWIGCFALNFIIYTFELVLFWVWERLIVLFDWEEKSKFSKTKYYFRTVAVTIELRINCNGNHNQSLVLTLNSLLLGKHFQWSLSAHHIWDCKLINSKCSAFIQSRNKNKPHLSKQKNVGPVWLVYWFVRPWWIAHNGLQYTCNSGAKAIVG